jgi:4-diphosphocytidyl-2-C-methyl-D-erythritol kinase
VNRPGAGWRRALAPAKLNLGLWIVRRRPDGFHDLVTLFQAIDLYDELAVRPRPRGFRLACDRPGIPTGGENLVIRAARALARAAGVGRGAEFRLTKRIPDGAGLGGGSSDAAAALILLDDLWQLRFGPRRLERVGATVGSDVPFFIRGGLQLGTGRGTRLRPLQGQFDGWFVVVHGPEKIPTKWAYSRFKKELTPLGPPPRIRSLAKGGCWTRAAVKQLDNHLEAGLLLDHPDIGARKRALLAAGAERALLTGSGSSVFGLFATREGARSAWTRLNRAGCAADLCRSVRSGVVMTGGGRQAGPASTKVVTG